MKKLASLLTINGLLPTYESHTLLISDSRIFLNLLKKEHLS